MKNPFKRKPTPKPVVPGVFAVGDTVRVKEAWGGTGWPCAACRRR